MKKIKCLTVVLALAMLVSSLQIVSFAAYDSSNPPVIQNVTFKVNNAECTTLPAPGAKVRADVYVQNTKEQTLSTIIAAYKSDNELESLSITQENQVIVGYPTISTNTVTITDETAFVVAFIWESMGNINPVSGKQILSSESRDTRLDEVKVSLVDGDITKTFSGFVNHDEKTVDVYVSTADLVKAAPSYSGTTKELSSGAEGHTTVFSNAAFPEAIKTAEVVATAKDENAIVSGDGVLDLSTEKEITVTSQSGIKSVYTLNICAIGYILNSNIDNTKLRYNENEIIVKDTENSWKYEANKFVSSAAYRNLAPAPMATAGFWRYGKNTFAIKDSWRYTRADYEANGNAPASSELFFSRLYTDIGKKSETDNYMEFVVDNDRTAGSATDQAQLSYYYDLSYKADLFKKTTQSITSFDYTVSAGDPKGVGIRFAGGTYEFAIKPYTDEGDEFCIQARAHYSDSAFNQKTQKSYSTLGTRYFKRNSWHNVQMVSKDMGEYVAGKKLIHTAYYIDGEYAGYTYSADQFTGVVASYEPGFVAFYNADVIVGIDNLFTGYNYNP